MKKRSNSLGLREKIFLFTMIPFVLVLLIISVLTIQNKTENERELITNSIESYVNLLESGDLSFETIKEKEWLETHFNEEVLLAELIKRDRSIVYSTSTSEHKIDEEIIDKVFMGYIVTYTELDEIPVYISIYPVIVKNIVVGAFHVQLSFEQSNNRIKEYSLFVLLLNLSGLIILFLLINFLFRKIVLNPIEELTKISYAIGKGNLRHKAEVKSDDELGILASTFNNMTSELTERNSELKEEKNKVTRKVKELKNEICQRKKIEKNLQISEERYRSFVENSSEGIWCFTMTKPIPIKLDTKNMIEHIYSTGYLSECNDAMAKIYGRDKKEKLIGLPIGSFLPRNDRKNIEFIISFIRNSFHIANAESHELDANKKERIMLNSFTGIIKKGYLTRIWGVKQDITKQKRAGEQIEKSLKEKEVLLKEIHHRVKNNLQIVSSLLRMQTRTTKNKDINNILAESRNRINAMALIHAQLYENKNMSEINMKRFMERLMTQLLQSNSTKDIKVIPTMQVENYPLPIAIAMPIGLITNELITNSLKHAFTGRKTGKIKISLTASRKGKICITVNDDGVGLPKGFDADKSKTLGIHLVKILTEEQLQGKLKITSKKEKGSQFKIEFNTK